MKKNHRSSLHRVAWFFMAIVLVAPSASHADEPTAAQRAEAKKLYERAIIHYRSGELEKAAVEFKDSFEVFPRRETLFNLAQTHRLLKNYEKAVFFYKQYLSMSDANSSDRKLVQERVGELEKLLQEQQHAHDAPPSGPDPVTDSKSVAKDATTSTTTDNSQQLTIARSAPAEKQPLYKKWWLWTTVGAVAAVGVGVGLGVALGSATHYPSASPSDGTIRF